MMMTYEEVMALLKTLGDDVSVFAHDDVIRVTVEDFEGFDDDYCEVMRDYDEDAVDEVLEALEAHCAEVVGDFYTDYYFEGFSVRVGYASYDI